jgi:chromosomal replication initiator protein
VKYYNVKMSDLQSKKRHKSIAFPRQVCMFLARRHTRYSLEEIGGYFGGRDHTTVLHAVRTVDADTKDDREIARQLTQLEGQLTGA